MAVRIRMKKFGRRHRPFFRICALDQRTARDGRVLEELGTYDPKVVDTDARAVLNRERIDYWLSVGAKPSDNVQVLIKKYGTGGSHTEQQARALERLAQPKVIPDPGPPASTAQPPQEKTKEPEAAKATSPPEEAKTEAAPEEAAQSEPEGSSDAKEEASGEASGGDTSSDDKTSDKVDQ